MKYNNISEIMFYEKMFDKYQTIKKLYKPDIIIKFNSKCNDVEWKYYDVKKMKKVLRYWERNENADKIGQKCSWCNTFYKMEISALLPDLRIFLKNKIKNKSGLNDIMNTIEQYLNDSDHDEKKDFIMLNALFNKKNGGNLNPYFMECFGEMSQKQHDLFILTTSIQCYIINSFMLLRKGGGNKEYRKLKRSHPFMEQIFNIFYITVFNWGLVEDEKPFYHPFEFLFVDSIYVESKTTFQNFHYFIKKFNQTENIF